MSPIRGAPRASLADQDVGNWFRVNLNWSAKPPPRAWRDRLRGAREEPLDLDLGCLYRFTDGSIGVVQPLGAAFTSLPQYEGAGPVIRLDSDDRTGRAANGETLTIDLSQASRIRRILVFASIYSGATNWAEANATVTVTPQTGAPSQIRLDDSNPGARNCAVLMLENSSGQLEVQREMRYLKGYQQQVGEAYDWGLRWTLTYKR